MSQVSLQSANKIIVPDRAGQLIVQRKSWLVSVVVDADTILVGYLPAGCRIHVPSTQIIFEAAVPNCDVDLLIVDTGSVLINSGAHTTATLTRVGASTYSLAETLGVSSENRAILLLANTHPATAAGSIHAEVGYFAPG